MTREQLNMLEKILMPKWLPWISLFVSLTALVLAEMHDLF